MSKYTTGELAKLCGVTVRTVQYYDTRGILTPSELSDGGRRLYTDDDLRLMKIICFLRDLGLGIDPISQLLAEDDPGSVISLLLDQQELSLKEELGEREAQLRKINELRAGLKDMQNYSLESIGDIAYRMSNKNDLKKFYRTVILIGVPLGILQISSIVLWIVKGWWWLFVIWAVLAVPFGIIFKKMYLKAVAYICPQCHKIFQPAAKEAIFANHTPSARKLTCPSCGHKGFCVEVSAKEMTQNGN